ncbi:MAG: hypothetical protein NT154_31735 [Verrucomicrobia bacterium]|nr:hypothetical protein [Verrucomicrobiota bacterium]
MASDVHERLRWQVVERAYHVCEYCLVHEDDTFHRDEAMLWLSTFLAAPRLQGRAIFGAPVGGRVELGPPQKC